MLVLLPMSFTLVKYRGWYSDFNRPFKISSAYFRCFLSSRNHRHFQQPLSLGEGANMCRNDVRNVRSWQVKCLWIFPHMWAILCVCYSLMQDLTFPTSLNYDPSAENLITKLGQCFNSEMGRIFLFVVSSWVSLRRTQCAPREPSWKIKLMDQNSNEGILSSFPCKA